MKKAAGGLPDLRLSVDDKTYLQDVDVSIKITPDTIQRWLKDDKKKSM